MRDHGIDSRMHVAHKRTDDCHVTEVSTFSWRRSQFLDRQLWRLQKSPVKTWRSPARFGALSARWINEQEVDLIHLHWVTDGFVSIEEIGRIQKPVVWSIYDMWPFMGTEHYGAHDEMARWRTGYISENRPESEGGFDLDRWTFARKMSHWKSLENWLHVAPASAWMQANIHESVIGRDWKQAQIPHVVDTNTFTPMPRADARRQLQLEIDADAPTLLFLSSAGLSDRRKGWDLLQVALESHEAHALRINVLIVGPLPAEYERRALEGLKFARLHWIGPVNSDSDLRLLYCASDAVAIPSREDNLPLVALEAQSCGRPVLALAAGGLADVVDPRFSGYLAEPGDSSDLAHGITHVLAQRDSNRIREHALGYWSPEAVVPRFSMLYNQLL